MINKIIIFLIIISNLIIFSASSDDQISFDVTEIEILDDGNTIIGKKRGTITTNNGFIIEQMNLNLIKLKIPLKHKETFQLRIRSITIIFLHKTFFIKKMRKK